MHFNVRLHNMKQRYLLFLTLAVAGACCMYGSYRLGVNNGTRIGTAAGINRGAFGISLNILNAWIVAARMDESGNKAKGDELRYSQLYGLALEMQRVIHDESNSLSEYQKSSSKGVLRQVAEHYRTHPESFAFFDHLAAKEMLPLKGKLLTMFDQYKPAEQVSSPNDR